MNVKISELPNGIRVVSDHYPSLGSASVGVFVDAGARHEEPEENGLSHMLEHMAFKGTKSRSARRIAEEIESVGGHLNAYTAREQTTYYARILKDDAPLAVDLLADILQNATFAEEEFVKEKDVILQEIGQANDTPDDIIFDNLQNAAFPDQPVGRSILGTAIRVKGFATADLRRYLERHYTGPSIVVAAAGHIDHDALAAQVAEKFGGLPPSRRAEVVPGIYRGGQSRDSRDLEQLHITAGFSGFSFSDPDYYALQVFSMLYGGGMSSRLFQEVREERGLAYSVYSFAASHKDSGLFGIYAGTSPEDAGALLPVIGASFRRILDDLDESEIARSRVQLKAGLVMALESTSSRIEQMGRQMQLFGHVIPAGELARRVDAVDMAAVKRTVERLSESPVTLATVGPDTDVPDAGTVREMFL